jgi:ligand-binding sensor domain-containing protein/serine phosphatase RsbU (regulator of sigma subunit)
MQFVKTRNNIISTFWCLVLFSAILNGQTYRFRNYGTRDKLADPYIYTINQDNNGFLWLGTGTGLIKFDGFNFYNVAFPDSVTNKYASVSLKDKNGNLWFGCNDGTLFYTSNNNLIQIRGLNVQSISDLVEGPDGFIWVIPQDRVIFKINENNTSEVKRYRISRDIQMTTACLVPGGKMFLGTQERLLYCSVDDDTIKIESTVNGIEYSKIQSIVPSNIEGKYILGVAGGGVYKLQIRDNAGVISRFPDQPEFESIDVKSIFKDQSGLFWINYGAGLYLTTISKSGELIESKTLYNKTSGLPGENARTVFQDMEGSIWIGFYGEGLSLLTSNAFNFFAPFENPEANNIIYVNQINNRFFLGTPKGYYLFNFDTGKQEQYTDLYQQVGRNEIMSYLIDKNNKLWIGTKGGGLFLKNLNGRVSQFYRSENNSEEIIKHIATDGNNLWLSTFEGVIVVDINSGVVLDKFKIGNRLPHNNINQIFIKRDGGSLVATDCDRLYEIRLKTGVSIGNGIMAGTRNKINCITESSSGEILAGTEGNGVFIVLNDSVSRITTENGLFSNYCHSIFADSDNKIWIGHERGFSRYDLNTGTVKAYATDFAKGGDCNPMAIYETKEGKILIGTTEGLIYYDRLKEKQDNKAPISNILSVTINDSIYPFKPYYSLPYKKRYRIMVNYVGINLSDPGKVSYMTRMDNIDVNWSEIKLIREASYNPGEGKYKFNLRSISEEGLSQETPASFELYIKKPFFRTWWFFIIVISFISGIVAIIINIREKSQREIKEYLESELAERTRVVLKQKDEIELQNIEITDSINYAKRIQSSILPDVNKLRDSFKDAFIIFHPRDIVSGDFYWFDKIDEERFVIVCADSTGHGVPGAFMSMIGSTLLQDIVTRKGITKPSEILTLLDKQIFSTLNQNIDVGVSNDGMDMVVCEFNVKTRHIRFASAMRPVIIVLDGEPYYIRGNRCSVGGESVIEKYFDDQEYFLAKEDTIYLFSDGLPDQFGGPDGKKMKIARLKKLIEEVSKLPMAEQKEIISNFFFDWKGDYEQVDDILLMGIKI